MSRPLRVLFLHSSDELYGSDRVLADLVTRLDPSRFRATVVLPTDVPGGGALSRRLEEAGIPLHRRPLAVLRRRYLRPSGLPLLTGRLAADMVSLGRLASRDGVDVIYSNTLAVQSGALLAHLMRRPHVWHVHEIVETPRPLARALRASLRWQGGQVIAVSHAVAAWAGPDLDLQVVHNGIEEPLVEEPQRRARRARLLRGHRGPLVGWVSRISTWKGHEVFLDLAERTAERLPEAVFVLAGGTVSGCEELAAQITARLARSRHRDRIRYLGLVPDGPRLVAALDVLVACPTRPDPFPRVVEEAQWQGVPVLGARLGGLPELVQDGVTGRLVDRSDAALLAPALEAMCGPRDRARMAAAARRSAVVRFSMRAFMTRVEEILACASSRSGPGNHHTC